MLNAWSNKSEKIGILTNGITETQKKKYRNLGLTSIIDEENVFVSGDLGYRKPDVNAFLEAARRISHSTSVNPADFVMIGDTYDADMKGALEAGFTTIWFNHRGNIIPDGGEKPSYIVTTMDELINLAKSI
jgi:putative hydrolase of the HAD superfamily